MLDRSVDDAEHLGMHRTDQIAEQVGDSHMVNISGSAPWRLWAWVTPL